MATLFLPDLLYAGIAREGVGLLVNEDGNVAAYATPESAPEAKLVRLPNKALFPSLANAHSHAFQRLFRARAEGRTALGREAGADTFWTWREQMYRAAAFVSPESMYDVARAVYLEMLASGITVVGEFHYLHNTPDGTPYANPNELALTLIRAAQSVGIRIVLLRSAYLRAGFSVPPHPGQRRFYETEDAYIRNLDALLSATANQPQVTVGAAPHSIRAVPLDTLKRIHTFAQSADHFLPVHIHLSEQPAENEACLAEYGQTPLTLLAENGALHHTTLIHAIHMTEAEFEQTAHAGAHICSCPTTERNLGDGIFPANVAAQLGIPVCYGTDSQAQIDILEDARQTEYHLRLQHRQRGILDGVTGNIGPHLLHCATAWGYSALGLNGGLLHPELGQPADFFTADLNDLALLGADKQSLATQAVFALSCAAIRDVAIAGKLILIDGHHPEAESIRARYKAVQRQFAQEAP
jgi:formimidoylglutamate deiminase